MDIVVDDQAPRPFTEADRKSIGKVRGPPPVSAKVLSLAEAAQRTGRRTQALNIVLAGIMAAAFLAVAIVEVTARDSFARICGLVLVGAMAVLGLAWRVALRRGTRLGQRIVDAVGISPAEGASITAREDGLEIGTEPAPWETIAVTRVGAVTSHVGDQPSFLVPDRLWLDVGGKPVHLDSRLMSNGAALVFAVYKRTVAFGGFP